MAMLPLRDRVRDRTLDDLQAPMSQVLAETAREALLFSPLSSIRRSRDLIEAERGPISLGGLVRGEGLFGEPDTPLLSADDARDRVREAGLALDIPDDGIREGALDILMERKRDEMRRQDIFARAPAGIGAAGARFGVSLAASMTDPVNIAAAFVPVVGPGRYSAMLANATGRAGRAGVRARVGATEGAAGAILVEPIVLGAARMEQADYDLSDTFMNIAIGSVLGVGLHTGAGFVSDAVRGAPQLPEARMPRILDSVAPETREAAIRSTVSQAVSGRRIDVEPILRLDPRYTELMAGTALGRAETGAQGLDAFLAGQQAAPAQQAPQSPLVAALTREGEARVHPNREAAERALQRAEQREPRGLEVAEVEGGFVLARPSDLDPVRRPDGGVQAFASERAARRAADTVPGFRGAEPVPLGGGQWGLARGSEADIAAARARPDAVRFAEGEDRSAGASMRAMEEARQAEAKARFDRSFREAMESARASFRPENKRLYDAEAINAGNARIAEVRNREDGDIARTELQDTLDELNALARNIDDPDVVQRELGQFDDLAQTAEAYGAAVRAAAVCGLRRG